MVRRTLTGKIECRDDYPVDLDCGCTALPGNDYNIIEFEVVDKDGKEKHVIYTTCDSEEYCSCNIWSKVLHNNHSVRFLRYDTRHLYSAEEEKASYGDFE